MARPYERREESRGASLDYRADVLRHSDNAALSAAEGLVPWRELDSKVRRYWRRLVHERAGQTG